MAKFNYTKMTASVLKLLEKFGTLTQLGDAATARNVNAVRLKDVKHTFEDSQIQIGDVQFIITPTVINADGSAGVDCAPLSRERFTDEFVIVQVEPIKPALVVMAYYVWVRIG